MKGVGELIVEMYKFEQCSDSKGTACIVVSDSVYTVHQLRVYK